MKIHIVKKGDTLYILSQKYNVPLEEILKLNPNITNPDVIEIGMKVKVPSYKPSDMDVIHQHVVVQGDTLWKLSKAWGVPLSDMIKANPQLKNPNVLLTGEVVNIPQPSMPSAMPDMNDIGPPHNGIGSGAQQPQNNLHPLHPMSMMQGVQGLMGKIPTGQMPFMGKKPTGPMPPKAETAPIIQQAKVPTMPLPTPASPPAVSPIAVAPPAPKPVKMPVVEKHVYPVQVQYGQQSMDLFHQYHVPAKEVMSLYDMPSMPGMTMTSPVSGGYGYAPAMPTGVSPVMGGMDWCPPESVMGSSALPWGAPGPMPYGGTQSGSYMNDGYTSDEYGYGYGQMPSMVSPASTGAYGCDSSALSPSGMDSYGDWYGYSPEQPVASPVGISPSGAGYGYPSAGSYGYAYGYGQSGVTPYGASPVGSVQTYGYNGYGQVSPVQSVAEAKKPCNCGCKDKRESEEAVETVSSLSGSGLKPAPRKSSKKVAIRNSRPAQTRKRNSLPWINR